MSLAIAGIGTALPGTRITQSEAAAIAGILNGQAGPPSDWLATIYSHIGITSRHTALEPAVVQDLLEETSHSRSVFLPCISPQDGGPTTGQRMKLYAQAAAPLAIEAAGRAIADSRIGPEKISHLVTVSCTGFFSPGVDFAMIEQLHLPATVQRTHVGFMGCHGAINGMRVAQAFVNSQPGACVLLCAVELPSLHCHFGADAQKIVVNALFADGAAALVGTADSAALWRVTATGSRVLPGSAADMSWTIGDHGFEMTLSRRVPDLIARHLRGWLEEWLGEHGRKLDQVASWIVHPGGPRILAAVEESLGLTPKQLAASRAILDRCGNMSSPTVLFILEMLRAQNAPRPAVALAFGPGMVVESALFA